MSLARAGAMRGHSLYPSGPWVHQVLPLLFMEIREKPGLSIYLAVLPGAEESTHLSVQSSLHPTVPSYPDSWADAAHALSSAIIKRLASHHEGLLWPPLTTTEPAVSTSLQDTRGQS